MLKEKFGFIGGGKMGEALCKGILNAGLSKAENIMVSDVVVERCRLLNKEVGVKTTQNNKDVASFADVIILAVKPQLMGEVLDQLKNDVNNRCLVVSIAAGIPIRFIESRLQAGARVIRVMPNTPCLVGVSATAFAQGKCAADADGQLVHTLFSAVGKVFRLDEKYLDAVTGLSGSGPAYVYMFIEALSDGGVKMGLPRDVATALHRPGCTDGNGCGKDGVGNGAAPRAIKGRRDLARRNHHRGIKQTGRLRVQIRRDKRRRGGYPEIEEIGRVVIDVGPSKYRLDWWIRFA